MDLSHIFTWILLGIVSFFASFVGTLSGGAAVLIIPALVFVGLPIHVAIGTSRIGAIGMMLTGGYQFHRNGKLIYNRAFLISLLAAVGAIIGAIILPKVSDNNLSKILGIVVLLIGISAIAQRTSTNNKLSHKISSYRSVIGAILFFFVGFWGGFIGAGYAIIAQFILIKVYGCTYLESAGISKVLGLGISICAAITYILQKLVNWEYGIFIAICMAFGSYYGAHYGIQKGEAWTQKIFIFGTILFGLILLLE